MRRRFLASVVLAVALLVTFQLLRGGAPAAAAAAAQAPAVPQATSRLAALRQERVDIARQAIEQLEQQFRNGLGEDAEVGLWQRRLFDAEVAAAADKAARLASAERYVNATRRRMELTQRQFQVGQVGINTVFALKYDLAGAECALEELKAQ